MNNMMTESEANLKTQFEVYLARYRKHKYIKCVAESEYDTTRSLLEGDVRFEHLIRKDLKKLEDANIDVAVSMSDLAEFINKYSDHIRFVE